MWVFYEVIFSFDLNEQRYKYCNTRINDTIFTDYKTLTRYIEFTANEYYETLMDFERDACWLDLPDREYTGESDFKVFKLYSSGKTEYDDDLLIKGFIKKVKMQAVEPDL